MYNINIIGNGRVTLSLLKMIFDQRLDTCLDRITIWSRANLVIQDNRVVFKEDSVNENIIKIYLMQNFEDNMSAEIEKKLEFRTFGCLEDLNKIKDINSKGVLILAVKYNLDELIYVDKIKKAVIDTDNDNHFELLLYRLKSILPVAAAYRRLKGQELRGKALADLDMLLQDRESVLEAVNRLSKNSPAGYTRLYNLEHSAVGVRHLSGVLNSYRGTVFNMINEVDTTNWILYSFSGLERERILSPCENDAIRARYFLKKNLQLSGLDVMSISLDYIGPHNHLGFIPVETVRLDGKPITGLMSSQAARDVIKEITKKTNDFGEEVFLKKGSSDEDTAIGICVTLAALLKKGRSGPVRVSCYDHRHQLFSGLPGSFRGGHFAPDKGTLSVLTAESEERLSGAYEEQKRINRSIMLALRRKGQPRSGKPASSRA